MRNIGQVTDLGSCPWRAADYVPVNIGLSLQSEVHGLSPGGTVEPPLGRQRRHEQQSPARLRIRVRRAVRKHREIARTVMDIHPQPGVVSGDHEEHGLRREPSPRRSPVPAPARGGVRDRVRHQLARQQDRHVRVDGYATRRRSPPRPRSGRPPRRTAATPAGRRGRGERPRRRRWPRPGRSRRRWWSDRAGGSGESAPSGSWAFLSGPCSAGCKTNMSANCTDRHPSAD